jgi:hypothetical protein
VLTFPSDVRPIALLGARRDWRALEKARRFEGVGLFRWAHTAPASTITTGQTFQTLAISSSLAGQVRFQNPLLALFIAFKLFPVACHEEFAPCREIVRVPGLNDPLMLSRGLWNAQPCTRIPRTGSDDASGGRDCPRPIEYAMEQAERPARDYKTDFRNRPRAISAGPPHWGCSVGSQKRRSLQGPQCQRLLWSDSFPSSASIAALSRSAWRIFAAWFRR